MRKTSENILNNQQRLDLANMIKANKTEDIFIMTTHLMLKEMKKKIHCQKIEVFIKENIQLLILLVGCLDLQWLRCFILAM